MGEQRRSPARRGRWGSRPSSEGGHGGCSRCAVRALVPAGVAAPRGVGRGRRPRYPRAPRVGHPTARSRLPARADRLAWPGRRARVGRGSRIAAAMRDWPLIRCEVTEEPSDGADGERYAMSPDLGVFRATMSGNGDVLVQEDRLRSVLATAADLASMRQAVDRLLGTAWDDELEPYRQAGDGSPVRWLSAV